MVQRDRFMER